MLTIGLVVTITLFASETLAVATIMPKIADDLGRRGYGAAFSAFFLGQVAGALLGGPAADRFRPAPLIAGVSSIFAAGLLAGAAASTIWVLVAGRALQGFGAGATTPVIYAVIARAYAEAARIRMFAITSTAWVTPALFGPGLAGLVAERWGWRWVFAGLVPLVVGAAAVTIPAVAPWLPSARDKGDVGSDSRDGDGDGGGDGGGDDHRSLPVRDALATAVGAALVLAAIDSRRVWLAAVLGAFGVALAARPLRRMLPAGTARFARGLAATIANRGLLTYAFVSADAFVPLAITTTRHRSVLTASIAVTLGTMTWTTGAWIADRVLARRGARWLIRAGFATMALGLAGELLLLARSVPLAAGLAGVAVAGLGIGLAYSPMSTVVLTLSPAGREGSASSGLSLLDNLGFAFGTAVVGSLVAGTSATDDPARPLAIGWTVAVIVAAAGVATARRITVAGLGAGDSRPDPAFDLRRR